MNLSLRSATSAHAIQGADPRAFIHPGLASWPRLLCAQVHAPQDMRVTLPAGVNAGASLRAALAPYHFSGAMGYICRGTARALQYHVVIAAEQGERPYIYGDPIHADGEVTLINGTLNLGRDNSGAVLLHCHGAYADEAGELHGGHVILDQTVVGAEPLVLHLCLFGQGGFVQRADEETHYNLLQPFAGALQ